MGKNERKLFGYISSNRSKTNLKIHLIPVCKYRKKLLLGNIKDDIRQIIFDIEKLSDFSIIEMQSDKDYIHIMLQFLPKISVSSIVNRIKSISTNRIWKLHHELLSKEFWKEKTFWSDGFFACSIGEASHETIKNYIANQG